MLTFEECMRNAMEVYVTAWFDKHPDAQIEGVTS